MDTNTLVAQLVAGFDALQEEYQKLHAHQATVERKLATARDQVRYYICYDSEIPCKYHAYLFPTFMMIYKQLALDL